MAAYNVASLTQRDAYAAQVHLPGDLLETVLAWAFQALPDEILVGWDANQSRPHVPAVEAHFRGASHRDDLFAGQGHMLTDATFVNQGDSWSVHHVPEEWTDGIFGVSRGPRGGRFLHWMHTHPNAVAIPSGPDAEASSHTMGVDMILGIEFSPEGPLPWFDEVGGERRRLQPGAAARGGDTLAIDATAAGLEARSSAHRGSRRRRWRPGRGRPVLGLAPTGHRIHGLELIAFHRSGLGVNVIFVDDEGLPYGWSDLAATADA